MWWIHVDIWQNQYNIVKLKNKRKKKNKSANIKRKNKKLNQKQLKCTSKWVKTKRNPTHVITIQ